MLLTPFGARPVLDSYDYDDDGLLSRAELFNDTQLNLLQIQVGYSW